MKKKNKNQLPQLGFGAVLAPQLFDLAANTLTNLSTYAVTDMIKAIREPKQEMRPTKMNTGFTMENGGTVGDPTKKKFKRLKKTGELVTDEVIVKASDFDENFQEAKKTGKKYNAKSALKKVQDVENFLGGVAVETAFDQIPYLNIPKALYSMRAGRPLTAASEFIKTYGDPRADALINSLQNNPSGYDIANLEDKYIPELQIGKKRLTDIGKERLQNKSLPAFDKAYKQLGVSKKEFVDFINQNMDLGRNYEQALGDFKKKLDYQKGLQNQLDQLAKDTEQYAMGGMIKRADGSYSKRGLWDNIRANKGSGKKPTKQMLEQERKIRAAEKAFGGMIKPNAFTNKTIGTYMDIFNPMAFGGMITPDMYMQQLMYGSYAMGGQVPQNIPVEVEGGEAYELPNGQIGEFEGPSHDNGGIPVALPEQTKVYSKQLKVIDTTKLKGKNGKTMAERKLQREANVAKLEKILSKNPSDKFVREALKRQQETAALEEQQDMAMQEQANQQQQMQEQAQQGMMQEQAMAGLMQDPAMMQQMGMMMYGGTLNKLANGGEPIKPLPMKQIYDLRYPNKTIDVPYNERFTGVYDNKPVTQEMFPLNNDMPNPFPMYNPFTPEEWKIMTNTKFRDDEDYPLASYPVNSSFTNSDELNKFYDAKLKDVNTLSRKSSLVPTVKNNYLEEMADLAQRASGGRGTSFTYYPNDYDGRDKQWPYVTTFGGKSMESNTNKYTPSVVKNDNFKPEPFLTEDQLNQLTNPQVNPLDLREKKGGVNVKSTPEMNPITTENLANPFTSVYTAPQTGAYPTIKEPVTSGQLPTYPLAMGVDPMSDIVQQAMMKGMPDPMAGKYPLKKGNKFMNFLNKAADKTGDFFTGLFDKKGKPKKEGGKKEGAKSTNELPYTPGDYMGMAGTLFGGLAPMTTTMLNRMMTPKNQNFFREYGAEGLRAMQEAQGLSAINRDKQLADIKLGEEASRQRGRNSARGVNTLRAMDIASDITANQAQNQAYNAYAQQMMQLLGQKGQMENMQDQMVMQGEYNRDLADRQDVDQFYTNLAENFASQSELMQKQGRDMNQAQYNKMILEMSPMFSKYGIGMEMKDGKYVMTHNGETIDQTKARLIVEKGIEAEKKTALEATKKEGTTTKTENNPAIFNPLEVNPYFNPIFTDINIPTVTDKSMVKATTKRRK